MNNLPFPIQAILIAAYIIMPITVLSFIRDIKVPQIRIVLAASLLYFVGEGLQFFHIGPAWIRHHVSDAGIVPGIGISMILCYRFSLSIYRVKMCRLACWIALILFLAYELLQFTVGKGDIIDVVAYHIGFLIAYLSFWSLERKWHKEDLEELRKASAARTVMKQKKRGPRHQTSKRKRR